MAPIPDRSISAAAWQLASAQEGVVSGNQLRGLGFSAEAIRHRIERGRLYRLWRDVFAVGRRDLTERGRWMAATLASGDGAALSHESAVALWGIRRGGVAPIHVSVPGERARHKGISCHRRTLMPPTSLVGSIPVTEPLPTLVDLAAHLDLEELTKTLNEADRLGLVSHDELASLVESLPRRRGIRKLRILLGAYSRTDSNLERRFLRIVDRAGLPRPATQAEVEAFRVDFFWPQLRLVVETDGLTYHRTPAQQAIDRKRDQVLVAAGFICLRFTNVQVRLEPDAVVETLRATAATLGTRPRR
jgi:very-short-patch-repair endonuclease